MSLQFYWTNYAPSADGRRFLMLGVRVQSDEIREAILRKPADGILPSGRPRGRGGQWR